MTTTAEYSRAYRQRYPDRARAAVRKYRESAKGREVTKTQNERRRLEKKAYVLSKLDMCVDCGIDDRRVLQFDHVVFGQGPNKSPIFLAATAGYDRIDKELAKCEVRCANCHVIRHNEEREPRWQR